MTRPRYLGRLPPLGDAGQRTLPLMASMIRACRVCGCTEHGCKLCTERTGEPCHWVAADLCSACEATP